MIFGAESPQDTYSPTPTSPVPDEQILNNNNHAVLCCLRINERTSNLLDDKLPERLVHIIVRSQHPMQCPACLVIVAREYIQWAR